MTAGQTIDGVLREQLERFLVDMGTTDGRRRARKDLRALLDAPAVERKPFGWFRTPKDCPLQGMFLHYDPEHGERDIQNALDFGFTVKRLYETPVAQPQGEPVAWIKPDVAKTLRKDECCYAFGSQNPKGTLIPLYAEQPAPVAVEYKLHMGDALKVFEALKVDRISRKIEQEELGPMGATEIETWSTAIGVTLEMHTAMGGCTLIVRTATVSVVLPDPVTAQEFGDESMANGWNACIDEVTRLNTK